MAPHSLKEIGEALQNQIFYAVAKDKDAKTDPESFITMCMPGLPYEAADFDFARFGFTGSAEEIKARQQAAFNFAMLVDVVPSHEAVYDGVAIWKINSASRLSTKYELILRNSKVAVDELSPNDEEALKKARAVIFTVKNEGKPNEEIEPTTKYENYRKYMTAYVKSVMEYNRKRLRHLTCPKAEEAHWLQDWQFNGESYLEEVKTAWSDWISFGYKGKIEEAFATIEQFTQRSAKQWKRELQSTYRANQFTGPAKYPFTTLTPANFAKGGWTTYSLVSKQLDDKKVKKYEEWQVGASGNWGLWHASGGAKSYSETYTHDYKLDEFEVEFEITQAQIVRPWFYPEFLETRGWKMTEGWENGNLSDGKKPPKGYMVAYPLHVIFIKDLKIKSKSLVTALKTEIKKVGADATVGYGAITFQGKYNGGKEGSHFTSKFTEDTVTVKGMQIIAFRNHLFNGKTPNPSPNVKKWE
ncbi:hypothetical protein [Streptomyces sp. NPDC017991]|uniref:hypothetical protein n=1 Tax=Streptomyces sp. NPDC017991 TaxID=3365026 RepID=UPI003794BEED